MFDLRTLTICTAFTVLPVAACNKPSPEGTTSTTGAQTTSKTTEAKGSGKKVLGSCNATEIDSCWDYAEPAGQKEVTETCADFKTAVSKEACPSAKEIGSCALANGVTRHFYKIGKLSMPLSFAKEECTTKKGTFTTK